jgi:alanine transaminase
MGSKLIKQKKILSQTKAPLFRCGSRGGYYELINIDQDVRMQVNKLISACLCSTAWGQAVTDAIINPPKEGEPSYELYKKERSEVFNRLKQKANLVSQLFNSIEGVRCNAVMGFVHQKTFCCN